MRRVLSLCMILMLVFPIVANVIAETDYQESQEQNTILSSGTKRFTNCYVEISGYIHNDWPAIIKLPNMFQSGWIMSSEEDVLFGLYSYMLFENSAAIIVYSEKNGDILWEHQKDVDPLITIIGFNGFYEFINPPLQLSSVTLEGMVGYISIRLKDYGR